MRDDQKDVQLKVWRATVQSDRQPPKKSLQQSLELSTAFAAKAAWPVCDDSCYLSNFVACDLKPIKRSIAARIASFSELDRLHRYGSGR